MAIDENIRRGMPPHEALRQAALAARARERRVVLIVATAAVWIPSRRASAIDPIVALRDE